MLPIRLIRACLPVLALFCLAAGALGDDRELAAARAKAALALSGTKADPVLAPAPRAVQTLGYAEAFALALEKNAPLTVYVGCDGKHPVAPAGGAVVARTAKLPGVPAGTVLIAVPVEGELLEVKRLPCADHDGVPAAVAGAKAKKAAGAAPKGGALPRPLDWDVSVPAYLPDALPVAAGRTQLDVLRDSLVTVRAADGRGGSGVVAYSEPGRSLVLTCWHCVETGGALTVRGGGHVLAATLIDADRTADVALLEVARELPAVPAVRVERPRTGEPLLMIGAASLWSRGAVTVADDARRFPSFSGDFAGTEGDSGGGVFVDGELVGVVRGRDADGPKVSCGIAPLLAAGIRRERRAQPAAAAPAAPAAACADGTCPLAGGASGAGCANGACAPAPAGRGFFRRR